ncbi:MAG: Na+/H+ antiporter subunit E [Lachnospiraceae bacterium]
MYIIFFLIWVIFNGQFTLEIAAFGLVIAGLMYLFICKFMGYKPKYDWLFCKKLGLMIRYLLTLIIEILKANIAVFKMIYTAKYQLEPAIVTFRADLHTTFARVLLANSITLTPGTITVSLKDNEYTVHCLDKELARGIDSSVFVQLLTKIERMD